ncbi:uncharacterized protein LOC127846441 [Dreissena polymorpha]|uniref:uncharacterized protein LOC127846441 n=1 Tax=Dreissena polymorpha TaxID=45954 RepID=UPI00226470C5|nr:uncharacterized protein LOC127846441 [Dreissena polymorpha]
MYTYMQIYNLIIVYLALSVGNMISFINCQKSIALNTEHDILMHLVDKMQAMHEKIGRLEANEKKLRESISVLIGTNAQFRVKIEDLTKRLAIAESNIAQNSNLVKESAQNGGHRIKSETGGKEVTTPSEMDKGHCHKQTSKRQNPTGAIAFTAYLDHVLQLRMEQAVPFNRLLLNEGHAYNNSTGIFRAPVSGIYLFSWAVTARKLSGKHAYDVWVKLVVNGNHQLGAVAETQSDSG